MLILLVVFFTRVVDLGYNSPFNDEAIYAVVGKMGLYYGDWESMNPFSWIGGIPFLYPAISGFFYSMGGIILVRLVNVFFFTASLFFFWKIAFLLLNAQSKKVNVFSLLPVIALGFSATGYYVSGLATYDMPSFFFFILGLYFLVLANKKRKRLGNYYFLSSIFLILGFYFKYTIGVFLPAIIIFSYLYIKNKNQKRFWIIYFLIPVAVGLLGLLLIKIGDLETFYQGQVREREKDSVGNILAVFLQETNYSLVLFALGSAGFFLKKRFKEWLIISLAPIIILLVHLVSLRVPTLDKHVLFAVGAFGLIGGLGMNLIYGSIKEVKDKQDFKSVVIFLLVLYCGLSVNRYYKYHDLWENTYSVLDRLEDLANKDDIVLTNLGAPVQLALFERTYPTNIFTSDWIYYEGFTHIEAAKRGVGDGYFRIIALEGKKDWMSEDNLKLHETITANMDETYSLVWKDKDYEIYLRKY